MLSPDLLDRRALAWLRLVDAYGRPVAGPVRIEGEGVRTIAKDRGHFAVVAAKGFEAHEAAFEKVPASPAIRTRHVQLDLTPVAAEAAPRRFDLRLPRDPDPAHSGQAHSLFRPADIEMLPGTRIRAQGSACLVRVTVARRDDGRLVEGALVQARTDNGAFSARGLTDARGEACLVFPALPLSFPGAGATIEPDLPARVVVTVDTDQARFHRPADLARAAAEAAGRTRGHIDPDSLPAAEPAAFATGAPVRVAAGREPSLSIEWQGP